MDIMDILGGLMQSEMSPSSTKRMRSAMGQQSDDLGSLGAKQGLDLQEIMKGLLGGDKGGSSAGGLGGMLEQMLGSAGNAVGGKKNLAVGGLGALLGSLLGGGKKSAGGAVGGGLMALLAMMAMKALQGQGGAKTAAKVPVGLVEPQTEKEQQDLQSGAELVVAAMINAVKADGQIDEEEYRFIVGKLRETNMKEEDMQYVLEELDKPMETQWIVDAAKDSPELAAQIYAATLMSIEVDTQAERAYVRDLASDLNLPRDVVRSIGQMVGVQPV